MIILAELLEDKNYRKFFEKQPHIPNISRTAPPYRLWVQRRAHGPWLKKDISSYHSGIKWLIDRLDEIHDGALAIKGLQSPPPNKLVKVKRNGVLLTKIGSDGVERPVVKEVPWHFYTPIDERKHVWCPYCRRPTIFTWFSKHHNMPNILQPEYSRCTICGCREDSVPRDWR